MNGLTVFLNSISLIFLRKEPADMPAGWWATLAAAAFFFFCGMVLSWVMAEPAPAMMPWLGQALRDNAVDAALLLGYFLPWLMLASRMSRAPHMLTALFTALGLLALMLAALWAVAPLSTVPSHASARALTPEAGLVLALFGWNILVVAQIVRRTFGWGVWAGMGVALGYFVCSVVLGAWVDGQI